MNKQQHADHVSVNIFDLIDSICGNFRRQWKAGKRPRIEELLRKVPEDASETLFRNLLAVEIRYRERTGDLPSAADYLARFPDFKRVIGDAFHYSASVSIEEQISTSIDAAREMPDTVDSPAASRIGDYELLRELGRGGFGVVFEAVQIQLGNRVALKTLPTGSDDQVVNPERLSRFRREFRSLSEINHPNLVGMQTLEVDGGQWFFTMDLVEGVDFLSYVRPDGTLDERRLRHSINQLVHGIIALHDRQILHRDLKPSNVMVDGDGRVVILDFGLIAELEQRADETASAHSRHFAGTPRYAAPEQALGQRSTATDWYAFGTMLYEALTGETPFRGTQAELLIRKQNDDASPLSGRQELPLDLASLVDGLLQRDPRKRTETEAIALALAIEFDSTSHGSSDSYLDPPENDSAEGKSEPFLIGREQQLSQLEAAKAELLERRMPLAVWLTGLSGEGKSTLAESFLRPLRRGQAMLVLSGRCYDREIVPFKVIDSQIDSLVKYLSSLSEPELDRILPPDIEKLAHLFPILRRVEPIDQRCRRANKGIEEQQLRNLAFAALKDLLHAIGLSTPVVMFVDDLQWGDRDSAEMLGKLLAPPTPPAVLLLGSFRSDEMVDSPFLREWNSVMDAQPNLISIHQIPIAALTRAECIEILRRRFKDAYSILEPEVDELYTNCRGNPYLLEQLTEGFNPETGEIRSRPLSEIIDYRLARCPEGASELLHAIAVGGKAVSPQEVMRVAGYTNSGLATLTHMRSERLVRLVDSQREQLVDTYHDKIRELTLESIDEDRRLSLHRTYAETIETQSRESESQKRHGDRPAVHSRAFDLAHHFEQARDPRAFQYLMQAGQAALETYAMDAAAEYLRRAERLRPGDTCAESDYRLQMMLGRALFGSKSVESSLDHLDQAATLATSPIDEAQARYLLAEARWRLGEYQESLKVFRVALAALGEKLPRSMLAGLLRTNASLIRFHLMPVELPLTSQESRSKLAAVAVLYAKYGHMSSHFAVTSYLFTTLRSCVLARRLNDPTAKTLAYGCYLHFAGICGFGWLAKRLSAVVKENVQGLSDDHKAYALYQEGCCCYYAGQLDEALALLIDADLLFSRSSNWQWSLAIHFQRHLWSVRGNANEIILSANRELELGRQTGDVIVIAWGLYGLADGRSRAGDFAKALRDAEESIRILESQNASTTLPIAYLERGRAELQASKFVQSRKSLSKSIKLIPPTRFMEITVAAFPLYVEAVLGTDWVKQERRAISSRDRWYATSSAFVARFSGRLFPNNHAHAHRVSGRLLASKGRGRRAIKSFNKAIAAATKIGAKYEHARALIDKSMLDHPDATADRERGLRILQQLGCVLPDAELDYLGVDRLSHHAAAKAAREAAAAGPVSQAS
ncbi:serine/threonine-protein kinase PknK [Stieleria sp.]|uniref:serine/threonine-protein kinase n=1 Tax=Stieleria sp. TaxID=2795976 RepID=UPI003562EBD1